MQRNPRHWTPEQHRRYIETLAPHLPAILVSLGYFLALPIIALGYLIHGANAEPGIAKILTWLTLLTPEILLRILSA